MSEQGIVVTLSGDGGDEVFTGYARHSKFLHRFLSGQTNKKTKHCKDIFECFKEMTRFKVAMPYNPIKCKTPAEYYSFIRKDCFSDEAMNASLFVETLMHLPEDYLIRNDKLGMNFSMEGRFPFTVPSFKNYCLGIPSSNKFENNNIPKRIPKEAYRNKLPEFIINKPKTGWAVAPSWFVSKEFAKYRKEVFSDSYHSDTNSLFNLATLRKNPPLTPKGKIELKPLATCFYFRVWAQKFNITL
tara:strand:- start:88 stop:816 length:729 start_codon:yes stop_codon:yes gene_type:complete